MYRYILKNVKASIPKDNMNSFPPLNNSFLKIVIFVKIAPYKRFVTMHDEFILFQIAIFVQITRMQNAVTMHDYFPLIEIAFSLRSPPYKKIATMLVN